MLWPDSVFAPYRYGHSRDGGEAYELNNQEMHSVMNKGSEDRTTFIFDYVPPLTTDSRESL
jgi:hypothetical protein